MDNDKLRALDQVLARIEKNYGKGAIMKLGDEAGNTDIEVIPTGCLSLDIALGIGGLPRGRIIEIYGPESSGKTTVALHAIAEIQKQGGIAAFVDAEHALDPVYAKKLGVDLDNLYVSQPDTGEQALDITDALVRSGAVDLIVIDSVAALTPKAEIEGDMGDSHVGLQARLMSQALRKLTGIINKSNCASSLSTSCVKRWASCSATPKPRRAARRSNSMPACASTCARRTPSKTARESWATAPRRRSSKTSSRLRSRRRNLTFCTARAFRRKAASSTSACACDVIGKSGAWFSYDGEKVAQGRERMREWLKNNPEKAKEIEEKIRAAYKPAREEAPAEAEEEPETDEEE